jgi:hypothetical protein
VRPELCDVAIIASDKVKSREAKASTRRVLSPSRLCLPVRHLSHNNQESIFSQRSDGMALYICYVLIEIDRCNNKSLLEEDSTHSSTARVPPQTSYCCLTQTYAILRDTDRRLIPLYLSSAYCCKGKSTCIHQPEHQNVVSTKKINPKPK